MQDSNTSNLIFNVPQLIAYLSSVFTLEPGDIIATGTPAGVGFARKPPRWLKPGDEVAIEVEGIGRTGQSRSWPKPSFLLKLSRCAPVAQLDRVAGFEPVGREFESLRAHHTLTFATRSTRLSGTCEGIVN